MQPNPRTRSSMIIGLVLALESSRAGLSHPHVSKTYQLHILTQMKTWNCCFLSSHGYWHCIHRSRTKLWVIWHHPSWNCGAGNFIWKWSFTSVVFSYTVLVRKFTFGLNCLTNLYWSAHLSTLKFLGSGKILSKQEELIKSFHQKCVQKLCVYPLSISLSKG